jgi:hypothetical protein
MHVSQSRARIRIVLIKVRINLRNPVSYQKKPHDFYAESPESTVPANLQDCEHASP